MQPSRAAGGGGGGAAAPPADGAASPDAAAALLPLPVRLQRLNKKVKRYGETCTDVCGSPGRAGAACKCSRQARQPPLCSACASAISASSRRATCRARRRVTVADSALPSAEAGAAASQSSKASSSKAYSVHLAAASAPVVVLSQAPLPPSAMAQAPFTAPHQPDYLGVCLCITPQWLAQAPCARAATLCGAARTGT